MIRDVNDNVPVIQPVGTLEVTETNSVDETDILTQLKVVDSDLSSEFEFSISSNPDGAFNVDSNGASPVFYHSFRLIIANVSNHHVM